MSEDLRTRLINELSSKFPQQLVEDLIGGYENVLVEFRKAAWNETLWKAGKFVERVFILLFYVVHSKTLDEVTSVNDLKS